MQVMKTLCKAMVLIALGVAGLAGRVDAKWLAYTANEGSNTVSVIDLSNNTVVKTIKVQARPLRLVASPDGRRVYVTNAHGNSLSVIDTVAGTVITNIPCELNPTEVCVTPDGEEVYVTNSRDSSITIIDATSLSVIKHLDTYGGANSVVPAADNRYLYYGYGGSYVGVLDRNSHTVTKYIYTGLKSSRMWPSRDGTKILVPGGTSDKICVIDTATQSVKYTSPDIGEGIRRILDSPDGKWIYAMAYSDGVAGVIEVNGSSYSYKGNVFVGDLAWMMDFSADSRYAYACSAGSGLTSIIDTTTRQIVKTVETGFSSYWVLTTPDGSKVLVTAPNLDTLTVINTATQQREAVIPVGATPWQVIVVDVPLPDPLPAPAIVSVTPTNLLRNAVTQISVTGSNFVDGCTASVAPAGRGTTVTGVQFVDASHLILTISTTATARLGAYELKITNPDAQSVTQSNAFNVVTSIPTPPPGIIGVDPTVVYRNYPTQMTMSGSNFVNGCAVLISPVGRGTTVSNVQFLDSQTLAFTINTTSNATLMAYSLTARNPDSQSATLSNAFTVQVLPQPAPQISGVAPTVLNRGWVMQMTVTGENFVDGCRATVSPAGRGTAVSSVQFVDSQTLVLTMSMNANARLGLYSLTITNPDNQAATLPDAFTVQVPPPAPSVTSVDPTEITQGAVTQMTVTGNNFVDGCAVTLDPDTADTHVDSVQFVDAQTLVLTITTTLAAPLGPYSVTITNPDTQFGTLADAFEVVEPPPPSITSVDPTEITQGTVTQMTVTGNNFVDGCAVTLDPDTADTHVDSVQFVDAQTLVLTITTTLAAPLGPYSLTVTNPDTQFGTLADAFDVVEPPPPPTITGVDPTVLAVDTVTQVTVTGSDFVDGCTASLSPETAEVAVTGVQFVDAGTLVVTVTTTAAAPLGPYSLTVTNPDTQAATLTDALTVQ
jgi:YVTN family beta-propeller protein